MTAQSPKPPRELKLHISLDARVGNIGVSVEAHNTEFTQGEIIHVREILPDDDSARVSIASAIRIAIRLLRDDIKDIGSCDCGHEEGNGLCRIHEVIEILERIEREGKAE